MQSITLKPFLKYPGGKSRELKYITPVIPPNIKRYFEPFIGGGSVYFSMNNMEHYYINDYSTQLINLYESIQKESPEFFQLINEINLDWIEITNILQKNTNLSVFSKAEEVVDNISLNLVNQFNLHNAFKVDLQKSLNRKQNFIKKQQSQNIIISDTNQQELLETATKTSYYNLVRKLYNSLTPLNSAFFFFIREFCYSSMFRFNKNNEFNVPYGGMSYNRKDLTEKINYIKSPALINRLKNTTISNLDFQDFFKKIDFEKNDFIFLDPPYDTEFSTYDLNIFNECDQIRLANSLKSITTAKWLLVIKDTKLIRSLYPENNNSIFYNTFDKTYSVSFKNRNNKESTHLMISNYDLNHDSRIY